jgi:hypothetical protein
MLSVIVYILNRFYCFFEDHADVVRQIIVKRGNENAMYNKTVIEFDFCDIPNYKVSVSVLSILPASARLIILIP